MKNFFTTAFLLFGTITLFAQAAAETAIKETLWGETQAYMSRNHDDWASFWHQKGDVLFLVTSNGMKYNNWDSLSHRMKKEIEANPEPLKADLINSDYNINQNGDYAFVTYVQNWQTPEGDSKSYETRNLRKIDGKWKLTSMVSSPLMHEKTEVNVKNHLLSAIIMLRDLKRYDDGIKLANDFVALYPNSLEGYWGLADLYMNKKDKVNAMKSLEKAIAILPDNQDLKKMYEEAKKL